MPRAKITALVPAFLRVRLGFWDLTKQSYEPLWTFVDAFDEPVKPNLKACILLVESSLRGAQEVMSEDEEKEKAEKAAYEALGGNAGIADKLNAREGIVVPSNFKES